jgi:ectoine hydroxylase-related dioxygenase (phytanoyl-CoA dioxygenase family)
MLTAREQDEFFETGFVLLPDVFQPFEVAEMRTAFERLEQTAYRLRKTQIHGGSQFVLTDRGQPFPGVRIDRIVWCGAAEDVLSTFGRDPRLLQMASELLGSLEMHQLINQAHFKFPGDGVEFPWHQDSTLRRYGKSEWRDVNRRGSFVQTVTAIDDVTDTNGPLQFIPGSCKLGHVERPTNEAGWIPIDRIDPTTAVSLTMAAGSVLLFGPFTFHRSLPNGSDLPRRVFINGFAYPGANSRVYPGKGAGRLVRYEPGQSPAQSSAR